MPDRETEQTKHFFEKWEAYHGLTSTIDSYKLMAESLEGEIRGSTLDVGNGGVVNYDLAQVTELVLLDIAEPALASASIPDFAVFKRGDVTELPLENNRFDTILIQMVIHHLAGSTYRETRKRTLKAFSELYRTLKPGGRVVILESGLSIPMEFVQRACFALFRLFLRMINHPIVFQWNVNHLVSMLREVGFEVESVSPVPLADWIIILGRRWPTTLSPLSVSKIIARKRGS